jgi:biopolymer transport protein TolR
LVLLVIFMVTAPLLVTGVAVELPKSRAKPVDMPQSPLNITVDKEGQVFIDGTAVQPNEIGERLVAIAAEQSPENPRKIMLRGDTSVDYGSMMRVMGELNRAGLNSVNMVTIGSSTSE